MKISVIVTNYNYEKWLRRCIRSLINQSFDDYEIIIIDDYSTDNSRNILLEYQDIDKIKLVFNKSNVGVGCSSTIGAKKATGKYIVRVDADDYVHNDFLKCLYLWASFNNSHAVACDYQGRIWRNRPNILWKNKVHEVLMGYKEHTYLPAEEQFSFYHPKTIDRQEKQNLFYEEI